jgi:topoisomerase IA-like protein
MCNRNQLLLPRRLQRIQPRDIGAHPETGAMIQAGIGRFGPYLKTGAQYKTLPHGDDVLKSSSTAPWR